MEVGYLEDEVVMTVCVGLRGALYLKHRLT
jgi:hypothetical protein